MRLLRMMAPALLFVVACSSGGDDGTGPGPNLPQGSMSAKIDGANWAASVALGGVYSAGILSIAGTDNSSQTLAFATFVSAPGTFTIDGNVGTNATLTIGGNGWGAVKGRGTGTITVNSISSTGASGTFSFVLISAGSGANKNITEGRFDVKF